MDELDRLLGLSLPEMGSGDVMKSIYKIWKASPAMYDVLKLWQNRIYHVDDPFYAINLVSSTLNSSAF